MKLIILAFVFSCPPLTSGLVLLYFQLQNLRCNNIVFNKILENSNTRMALLTVTKSYLNNSKYNLSLLKFISNSWPSNLPWNVFFSGQERLLSLDNKIKKKKKTWLPLSKNKSEWLALISRDLLLGLYFTSFL